MDGTLKVFVSVVVLLVLSRNSGAYAVDSLPRNNSAQESSSDSAQMISLYKDRCIKEYSFTCFKLEVAKFVPMLSPAREFKIHSGLVLETGGFETSHPRNLITSNDVESDIDRYLVKGLDSFVKSLSLKIKVVDKDMFEVFRGAPLAADNQPSDYPLQATARKRRINNALMMGGMLSAATLLAVTMIGISALAGKAMMLSMISLLMTLLGNRGGGASSNGGKGGGGGGGHHSNIGKVSYEVIHSVQPHYQEDYWAKQWSAADSVADPSGLIVKPAVRPQQ